MIKILIFIYLNLFSFTLIGADCTNEPCMLDKAIEAAQTNRVKDASSPGFICMLSQWEGKLLEAETDIKKILKHMMYLATRDS